MHRVTKARDTLHSQKPERVYTCLKTCGLEGVTSSRAYSPKASCARLRNLDIILQKEERETYAIEKFWSHAHKVEREDWEEESKEFSEYEQ